MLNNNIQFNFKHGVNSDASSAAIIAGNTLYRNYGHAIYISSSGAASSTPLTQAQLTTVTAADNVIINNQISENNLGSIYLASNNTFAIKNTVIANNLALANKLGSSVIGVPRGVQSTVYFSPAAAQPEDLEDVTGIAKSSLSSDTLSTYFDPLNRGAFFFRFIAHPSPSPTPAPSPWPSSKPSGQPSRCPSGQPTKQPSRQPTSQPTRQPSLQPSRQPSSQPLSEPTCNPSSRPSAMPSKIDEFIVTFNISQVITGKNVSYFYFIKHKEENLKVFKKAYASTVRGLRIGDLDVVEVVNWPLGSEDPYYLWDSITVITRKLGGTQLHGRRTVQQAPLPQGIRVTTIITTRYSAIGYDNHIKAYSGLTNGISSALIGGPNSSFATSLHAYSKALGGSLTLAAPMATLLHKSPPILGSTHSGKLFITFTLTEL